MNRAIRKVGKLGIVLIVCALMSCTTTATAPAKHEEAAFHIGKVAQNKFGPYDWYVFVPRAVDKQDVTTVLLAVDHMQSQDYTEVSKSAAGACAMWSQRTQGQGIVVVVPAIPRDFNRGYYPQGLNYYSLRKSTPDEFHRPDLRVNKIIDDLIVGLRSAGYPIDSKILVAGFSAGGMWANRYTLLHPEKVKAAGIGQAGGSLAVPFEKHHGQQLKWPMGIADYEALTSQPYASRAALQDVPQFVFIGELDTATYFESYPTEQDLSRWAPTASERLLSQVEVLKANGYNVSIKVYDGVAHQLTEEMWTDLLDFLLKYK